MLVSRRHILKILGGGAVGTIFSPIPWKLLRDSSVWTQNWSWLPVPKIGPAGSAYSACTLCPSGCGLKVKTVGGRPVLVNGISNVYADKGGLCPGGTAIHQMPWHPAQVRDVKMRQADGKFQDAKLEEAIDAVALAIKEAKGTVAILDGRPGRAISGAYHEFLASKEGALVVQPPSVARSSMNVLRSLFKKDPGPLAVDLDQVKTVISFSAPVLENWGQPGLLQQAPGKIKTVQFEAVQSRTALKADQWIPITPGSEREIALGLAGLLLKKGYAKDWQDEDRKALEKACEGWTPRRVFEATGVDEEKLAEVAALMEKGSTVVLAGPDAVGGPLASEDEGSIQSLNLLVGAPGHTIKPVKIADDDPAYVTKVPIKDLADVPAQSIDVLIVDMAMAGNAIPWSLISSKLSSKALLVSLTPVLADLALHSQVVIPTALPFTAVQDIPGHPDLPRSVRVANAFGKPGDHVVDPLDFLNRLGDALSFKRSVTAADSLTELIEKQAEALVAGKTGSILMPGKKATDLGNLDDGGDLLKRFKGGGCFVAAFGPPIKAPMAPVEAPVLGEDEESAVQEPPAPVRLPAYTFDRLGEISRGAKDHSYSMQLVIMGGVERAAVASRSPLLSKVDQESGLNPFADGAQMNPATISSYGLIPKKKWTVSTPSGSIKVRIRPDSMVPPGVIVMSGAPRGPKPWDVDNPIELVAPGEKTWRLIPAQIVEA